MVTYRDGLPAHRRSPILVLTGSDVAQLIYNQDIYHIHERDILAIQRVTDNLP